MELLQLQYFSEVAKQGSVTKAAQILHVSQPALSQTIRRLEKELNIRLFEKNGRKIRLTGAGAKFYTQISMALNRIQNAAEDIQNERLQGNVSLGTYMPLSPLLPCIQSFAGLHPDVTFTFLSMTDSHILQTELMDGILGYDISNTMGFRERIAITAVPRNQIVPADHPMPETGPSYQFLEMESDYFVSLILPGEEDEEVFREFASAGIVPNIRYRTNSSLIKQEILEEGFACGFSNTILTQMFRDTGYYRIHSYPPESYLQAVTLAWRSNETLSPAARKFKEYCRQWFQITNSGRSEM